MTRTTRRPGVTLMEVLIATAILSVGMIAIMALFPIGAVNFARALNQDRAATHGVNSDELFRYYWKNAWVERDPFTKAPTGSICGSNEAAYYNSQEPMLLLLSAHPTYTPTGMIPPESSQAGFPVLVDVIGWQTKTATGNPNEVGFVAGNRNFPVRTTLRRAITLIPNDAPSAPGVSKFPRVAPFPASYGVPLASWNYPLYPKSTNPAPDPYNPAGYPEPYQTLDTRVNIRLATLLDDLTFDKSGEPDAVATGQIERAGRYNASWLIQRSRTNVPTDVNVQVLVFGGRSPTDVPSAETEYPGAVTGPGSKSMVIPLNAGQAPPALRRGAWVGFTMLITPTPANPTDIPYPTLDFYRVVGVDDSNANALVLELETAVKQQNTVLGQTYTGSAIVFDNLIEVFDRGVVSPTSVSSR